MSDRALNHYPRHVGDITLATFGLSFAEFGCYDRLLDAYYANEAPLPLDPRERHRMVGATSKADRAVVDYIVVRYFVEEADGWHNKRADEEIANYRERIETATKASRAGVAARSRGRQPTDVPDGQPDGQPSGQPDGDLTRTIDHKPEPEPKTTKVKNVGDASAASTRGTRLTEGWLLPKTWGVWALAIRPDWDEDTVRRAADEFRDYWIGVPGAKGRKTDWLATWRNRVRDSKLTKRANGATHSTSAAWWASEADTIAKGREYGLESRPGESWHDFRGRIRAKIESRAH